MADSQMLNPVHRARADLLGWFEALPKDIQMDAKMSLDKLCAAAEAQASAAYWDGYNSRKQVETIRDLSISPQES
jgi:hypothetical protein